MAPLSPELMMLKSIAAITRLEYGFVRRQRRAVVVSRMLFMDYKVFSVEFLPVHYMAGALPCLSAAI